MSAKGARGQVDCGLGKSMAAGSVALLRPTDLIMATGDRRVIDGVEFEFHHRALRQPWAQRGWNLNDVEASEPELLAARAHLPSLGEVLAESRARFAFGVKKLQGRASARQSTASDAGTNAFIARGGQIMDERIRNFRSWRAYELESRQEAYYTASQGGFHECVALDGVANSYQAIFAFAAGSHPYLDFGWGQPMMGNYPRFMTRYGEYCWDVALAPIDTDKAGITVGETTPLIWKPYVRSRRSPSGTTQTVMHLITAPTTDEIQPKPGVTAAPWTTGIPVHKRGTKPPVVWRLSAEPDVQCEKLAAKPDGEIGRAHV